MPVTKWSVRRMLAANSEATAYPSLIERGRCNPRKAMRSEEHTSELQSPCNLVCRLLLEKKKRQRRRSLGYDRKLGPQTLRAIYRQRRRRKGPVEGVRSVLHNEARCQGHWPRSQHLLRNRHGAWWHDSREESASARRIIHYRNSVPGNYGDKARGNRQTASEIGSSENSSRRSRNVGSRSGAGDVEEP